jgi:HPt (histidine-containing phosphotransfer) domain-containing protein
MALNYNLAKVFEISADDMDFAKQIAILFLKEVPVEVKQIKIGIEERDFHKVYSAAHKIKPTLDLLGMNMAYDENLQIMKWTKDEGQKKEIIEVYKSLKERLDATSKELSKDFNI